MTLQTLKIGRQEFVLVARRDFEKLAEQAGRQTEEDYWTDSALEAEAKAQARNEKPIAFDVVERELASRKTKRIGAKGVRRR